jgi:hypothetical protein
VLLDPRQGLGRAGSGRRRIGLSGRRRRHRLTPFDALLLLAVALVLLVLGQALWSSTRVHVHATGLRRHDALTFGEARALEVRITVGPIGGMASARLTLDGKPLASAEKLADGYRWAAAGSLTPGEHRLRLSVPRPVLPASQFTWRFLVDGTPPTIATPRVLAVHRIDEPVHVSGTVDTDATLTAMGKPVKLDKRGHFSLAYSRPPAGPISLVARDVAGHIVKREVFVPIRRPNVRGVHMSAVSWRTNELRQGVFDLIDAGKINAVELDLKDESGEIGYGSTIPLATRIGSVKHYYDLRAAVAELHRRKVRVIGRIVAFRDPILTKAAWAAGHRDWVVQTPDGKPHGSYGGFTNMAALPVQQYNLDIAAEASAAGVDEILWDYIRRPEGALDQIVFPGMPSTDAAVERSVVHFLTRSHALVRAAGVFQGASIFGIAAGDPAAVGQNVPEIARHVDFIAPMVYPSLWVPGEYRVADPARMPFAIVARALADFQSKSSGTAVGYTPWLQDFSLGVTYGDRDVRQQIDAAEAQGIHDWLLWSPRVRYHAGQLAAG